jgi:hypothetical protein
MKVVFTARRLKPGQYDGFRKAWEPERFPDGFQRAYILRDPSDPDLVIAFGLFDVSDDRADQLKNDLEPSERTRHEAMAPYVDETLVSGLYDVVYTMQGSADGAHTIVPLTERHIKPGTMEDYRATMQEFADTMGVPPPGLVEMIAMADTADPNHLIQLGILRTDDTGPLQNQNRGGREQMVERIAPFVQSVGIDRTFEMVEELTPSHA